MNWRDRFKFTGGIKIPLGGKKPWYKRLKFTGLLTPINWFKKEKMVDAGVRIQEIDLTHVSLDKKPVPGGGYVHSVKTLNPAPETVWILFTKYGGSWVYTHPEQCFEDDRHKLVKYTRGPEWEAESEL